MHSGCMALQTCFDGAAPTRFVPQYQFLAFISDRDTALDVNRPRLMTLADNIIEFWVARLNNMQQQAGFWLQQGCWWVSGLVLDVFWNLPIRSVGICIGFSGLGRNFGQLRFAPWHTFDYYWTAVIMILTLVSRIVSLESSKDKVCAALHRAGQVCAFPRRSRHLLASVYWPNSHD